MNIKYLSVLSVLALTVGAGCSQNSAPEPSTTAAQPEVPVVAAPAEAPVAAASIKGANNLLTATPGAASCDGGTEAKLTWDTSANPAVAATELLVGGGESFKTFAAGGPTGEADTGPWVYSGTVFILRNKSDQAELDRLVIAGPACPPQAAADPAAAPQAQ